MKEGWPEKEGGREGGRERREREGLCDDHMMVT